MDTWLTSSLTPLIVCGWEDDPDLFDRTFPMDLRPQGFEIIRTWLFSSVLRSQQLFDRLPWSDASINGWVLDPDRKKMSKSKGEVVTPLGLVDQHGADAIRYWAAAARPGSDTSLDANQFEVGRPGHQGAQRHAVRARPPRPDGRRHRLRRWIWPSNGLAEQGRQ